MDQLLDRVPFSTKRLGPRVVLSWVFPLQKRTSLNLEVNEYTQVYIRLCDHYVGLAPLSGFGIRQLTTFEAWVESRSWQNATTVYSSSASTFSIRLNRTTSTSPWRTLVYSIHMLSGNEYQLVMPSWYPVPFLPWLSWSIRFSLMASSRIINLRETRLVGGEGFLAGTGGMIVYGNWIAGYWGCYYLRASPLSSLKCWRMRLENLDPT